MKTFELFAGLEGGFGGANSQGIYDFENEEQATMVAYEMACEEYESYAGLHGIPDIGDILDEPEYYGLSKDCSEEDAWEVYKEIRETWIEYYACEVEV